MKKINETYYLFAQNKYMYLSKNTMREIVASDMTNKMKKFYLKRVVDIYEVITKYLDECNSIDEFINKVYILSRHYQEDEVLKDLLGVYHTSILSYEKNIRNIILTNNIREEIIRIYNNELLMILHDFIKNTGFNEEQYIEYMNSYTTLQLMVRTNLMICDYLDDAIEAIKDTNLYHKSWYTKDIFDRFVNIVISKVVKENELI